MIKAMYKEMKDIYSIYDWQIEAMVSATRFIDQDDELMKIKLYPVIRYFADNVTCNNELALYLVYALYYDGCIDVDHGFYHINHKKFSALDLDNCRVFTKDSYYAADAILDAFAYHFYNGDYDYELIKSIIDTAADESFHNHNFSYYVDCKGAIMDDISNGSAKFDRIGLYYI